MAWYDNTDNPSACRELYRHYQSMGLSDAEAQRLSLADRNCNELRGGGFPSGPADPYDPQGTTGGGSAPAPSGSDPMPADASPGEPSVTLPDGQSYDVSISPVFDRDGRVSKLEAWKAIAFLVVKNPQILSMIKRIAGLVVRDAPDEAQKGRSSAMLVGCLLDQLPKPAKEAICQYAGGASAPIGLSQAADDYFLAFVVLDAINAMGQDADKILVSDDPKKALVACCC